MKRALLLAAVTWFAARANAQTPPWTVEADPVVVIGPDAGVHGEFAFILSAALLSDGSIAVISRGTHDIRIFDENGTHLRTYGRQGAGPGEYEQPSYLGRAGDTLFIYDYSFRRVTALDAASGSVRTWTTPRDNAGLSLDPVARLRDGTLIAMPIPFTSMRRRDGTQRREIAVIALPSDTSQSSVALGRFPFITSLAVNRENRERATSVGFYDFGPSLFITRSRGLAVIGDGAEPRLQYFSAAGERVADITLPLAQRAFVVEAVARAREELLAVSSERARQSIIDEHDARYLPEMQPYFRELREGPDGEVWVELFRVDRFAPAEFFVVSAERTSLARVFLPPDLRPFEIGRDYVLGLTTDEDGVESIALHRYSRQP